MGKRNSVSLWRNATVLKPLVSAKIVEHSNSWIISFRVLDAITSQVNCITEFVKQAASFCQSSFNSTSEQFTFVRSGWKLVIICNNSGYFSIFKNVSNFGIVFLHTHKERNPIQFFLHQESQVEWLILIRFPKSLRAEKRVTNNSENQSLNQNVGGFTGSQWSGAEIS